MPRVMDLREALQAFLDHRQRGAGAALDLPPGGDRQPPGDPRRLSDRLSQHRQGDQHHPRGGRAQAEDDEGFELTDLQAESILNMRLRALRRLEEIEIKGEHKKLSAEKKELKALLKDEELQWQAIGDRGPGDQAEVRRQDRAGQAPHRARPTRPAEIAAAVEDMIEREPVTDHLLGEGLDPRREGPSRRQGRGRSQVQGGRRPAFRRPGRDHRQDVGVRHQWSLLHDAAATGCPAGAAMASRSV